MKAIKINGDASEILSVELKDVLNCINYPQGTNWGLLWLYATANLDGGKSIVDLENKINGSDQATLIGWEELLKFSYQLIQTIDIVIIGDKDVLSLVRYSTDKQMYECCDFCIELIDSSYWLIHSNDLSFINNVFDRLEGVEYYYLEEGI